MDWFRQTPTRPIPLPVTDQPQQQGFTLIEVLVSVVLVSIALAAILPSVIVSAANQINTQRIEEADALAFGAVSELRTLVESGEYEEDDLPTEGDPFDPTAGDVENVALNSESSTNNYRVQVVRIAGTSAGNTCGANDDAPCAFCAKVRVFHRFFYEDASDDCSDHECDEVVSASATGIAGINASRSRPLAVYGPFEFKQSSDELDLEGLAEFLTPLAGTDLCQGV